MRTLGVIIQVVNVNNSAIEFPAELFFPSDRVIYFQGRMWDELR